MNEEISLYQMLEVGEKTEMSMEINVSYEDKNYYPSFAKMDLDLSDYLFMEHPKKFNDDIDEISNYETSSEVSLNSIDQSEFLEDEELDQKQNSFSDGIISLEAKESMHLYQKHLDDELDMQTDDIGEFDIDHDEEEPMIRLSGPKLFGRIGDMAEKLEDNVSGVHNTTTMKPIIAMKPFNEMNELELEEEMYTVNILKNNMLRIHNNKPPSPPINVNSKITDENDITSFNMCTNKKNEKKVIGMNNYFKNEVKSNKYVRSIFEKAEKKTKENVGKYLCGDYIKDSVAQNEEVLLFTHGQMNLNTIGSSKVFFNTKDGAYEFSSRRISMLSIRNDTDNKIDVKSLKIICKDSDGNDACFKFEKRDLYEYDSYIHIDLGKCKFLKGKRGIYFMKVQYKRVFNQNVQFNAIVPLKKFAYKSESYKAEIRKLFHLPIPIAVFTSS